MLIERDCKVRVNGVDFGYDIFGHGDKDLIFLHGYSIQSTGEIYTEIFKHLSEYFRIIALDVRGHGKSAAVTENWTFAQIADDIAAVVKALDLKSPAHAGHSFGGFMGLFTELNHPGTFSAINLLAPSAASGGSATPDEVRITITNEGQNNEVMAGLYSQMYVRPYTEAMITPLVKSIELMDLGVHKAYFYQEYDANVITDQLDQIKAPTLILIGAHDEVVSTVEQHATAQGLPNYKEVIFSDEGHMVPLEAPERTAREIINFCKYDI
jgi:pimeloyl-ACP methyl ester carboxylesterase